MRPAAQPAHRQPIGHSQKFQGIFSQPGTSLFVQRCSRFIVLTAIPQVLGTYFCAQEIVCMKSCKNSIFSLNFLCKSGSTEFDPKM